MNSTHKGRIARDRYHMNGIKTPRKQPYVWVTWITKLLAGEASCVWAAWVRSHFTGLDKVPDDSGRLATWSAKHAGLVRMYSVQLQARKYTVTEEDQNKFTLTGKTGITLGGKPDLVAVQPHGVGGSVIISEVKTGRRRHSDVMQVCTYMLALDHVRPELKGHTLSGEVVYGLDDRLPVTADDVDEMRSPFAELMARVGGQDEPETTPSYRECRWCDLAGCPDRVMDEPTAKASTDLF